MKLRAILHVGICIGAVGIGATTVLFLLGYTHWLFNLTLAVLSVGMVGTSVAKAHEEFYDYDEDLEDQ